MLRIVIRFPLGVYHAQAAGAFDRPEWPPSPVRLIGALLAAAHGRLDHDPGPDRALLQRLCEASPPLVVAPPEAGEHSPTPEVADPRHVARLRGATRWAPRNHELGELKQIGLSTRDLGRGRAEVHKVGVAIGDLPVAVVWPELELSSAERQRLTALAADVTFVGTSRSPALVEIDSTDDPLAAADIWRPADRTRAEAAIRVPDGATLVAFDRREAARRSTKDRLEKAGVVPAIRVGRDVPYALGEEIRVLIDPQWWGDMIVLAVDHDSMVPKAPAAYLVARATRAALLGAFGAEGSAGEAPPITRGRGAEPHCAIVPLPDVWHPRYASGRILGVAVVLPHAERVTDLPTQRARLEVALARFDDSEPERRHVDVPGVGRLWLRSPTAVDARRKTLASSAYVGPARTWVSVTPVVHSRWRTNRGADSLLVQVTADCADAGLPEPDSVALLRGAGRPGGASRIIPPVRLPEPWRGLLRGPTDHVRITFPTAVRGPVLLGRARHFGLGLCVPEHER